jgi:hypothetical protein
MCVTNSPAPEGVDDRRVAGGKAQSHRSTEHRLRDGPVRLRSLAGPTLHHAAVRCWSGCCRLALASVFSKAGDCAISSRGPTRRPACQRLGVPPPPYVSGALQVPQSRSLPQPSSGVPHQFAALSGVQAPPVFPAPVVELPPDYVAAGPVSLSLAASFFESTEQLESVSNSCSTLRTAASARRLRRSPRRSAVLPASS